MYAKALYIVFSMRPIAMLMNNKWRHSLVPLALWRPLVLLYISDCGVAVDGKRVAFKQQKPHSGGLAVSQVPQPTRQGPRLTLGSETGERTPKKVVFQLWRSVSQPKKNSTVKISPSQLGVYCQNCGSNVRIVVQIVMNEQYTYF